MTTIYNLFLSTLFLASFALGACSNDSTTTVQKPQEFIATDADFANYRTWTLVTSAKGPDPAGILGDAHAAQDSNITRYVYVNDGNVAHGSNGEFPVGTRFVKEIRMPDGTVAAVTVMAKRGGGFNTAHKGWEWFFTDKDGKITSRGADLMNNMCNGCHSANANKDYVFTK